MTFSSMTYAVPGMKVSLEGLAHQIEEMRTLGEGMSFQQLRIP